jgi:putative ABC transport system permease protein
MAVFSLLTGALVLVGAVATSRFQRIREGALLRTWAPRAVRCFV